jgi:hypothetical protein
LGFDELGHRDRLRQIGLATGFPDALLVALHRKRGHCDNRNGLELEPNWLLRDRRLPAVNVHQNQVGAALAGEIERPDAVARADGMVGIEIVSANAIYLITIWAIPVIIAITFS